MSFKLGEEQLSCDILSSLSKKNHPDVTISEAASQRLERFRAIVEEKMQSSAESVYGINTGFGFLSHVKIPKDQLEKLQLHLIRSHACGVGEYLEPCLVRAIMISRSHSFLLGHSGVSFECINMMITLLKADLLPLIPSQGSVGASGDLAPLAHFALGLIGEGQCLLQGDKMPTKDAFKRLGIKSYSPKAKEGLALINGTQVMSCIGARCVQMAKMLLQQANIIAAISLEAIKGTKTAFDEKIHGIRSHPGQVEVASHLRQILSGSDEIMASHADCQKVQDPYSFRCIPQVHGASLDAIHYVENVINKELNSVTDNPLIFEDGSILSGGNFHGQPVALACDFLTIACAEIGSLSERRLATMINPHTSGLPAFLVQNSGINSGYMIPHVVSAALVSENKTLCFPASVDTIPTSADKEDHVSMGTIAARKAWKVIDNLASILSIELLAACQGADFHSPLKASSFIESARTKLRSFASHMHEDQSLHDSINLIKEQLMEGAFLKC